MATINDAGAAVKTLRSYLDEVQQAYRDIDSGWNIEPESPDGQAIAVWTELLANLDEQLIAAYRSVDPDTAVGEQLDRIARISGIDRQDGTPSTATVTFSGTSGTVIPTGTEVRNTETGTKFSTDQSVEISSGEATVGVTANVVGPEPAGVGDLSEIATPIGGVSSVTNDDPASLGRPVETDALLRVRRNNSVAAPGRNQVDSMFGTVANVEDVKHTRIYENFTASTDSNGLGPHSIAVFVDGGTVDDVSEAVANNKNPGTGLNKGKGFGANEITEEADLEAGGTLEVTFFRPTLVSGVVEIEVTGEISGSTQDDIKGAVVDYANAELFGGSVTGFDKTGFGIGELVPAGKLYTPVNRVIGDKAYVSSLTVGEEGGSTSEASIDPGFDGLVVLDTSRVNITVV